MLFRSRWVCANSEILVFWNVNIWNVCIFVVGVSSPSEKSLGIEAGRVMVPIFTSFLDTRDIFSPDDEFGEEPSNVENCIRTK